MSHGGESSRLARAIVLALGLLAFPASADGPQEAPGATSPAEEEAAQHYAEARRRYDHGEHAAALAEIDASIARMASPNSDLLRGHVLRELRRRSEAMGAYVRAQDGAIARVRNGETRFEATLAESGRWIALLRAALAELVVVVPGGVPGLTIDGAPVALEPSASGEATARVWHEPGGARIEARFASGAPRVRSIALTAGSTTRVEMVDVAEAPARRESPTAVPRRGPPLATWVAGGIGVAGIGTFAILGTLASGVDDDLASTCSPHCAPARRADADRGRSLQAGANVGLAVGAAGLFVAAAVWLFTGPPPATRAR